MAEAVVLEPGHGEVVADTETRRVALLSDREEATVTESWYAAGQTGPGPHVHHRHVDAFYILAGSLVFAVGPQAATEVVAGPGTLLAVEEEVLELWRREDLFRRTLQATEAGEPFVFYEGPPTANGRPGLHHIISRTIKDLVCRHRTMQGRRVTRIAGSKPMLASAPTAAIASATRHSRTAAR